MKIVRMGVTPFSQIRKLLNIDYLVQWLLLMIAVSVCILIFKYSITNERVHAQLQFKLLAEEQVSSIYNCITRNNTVVNSVASFFNGSDNVTRKKFKVFVQPFLKEDESIQALQWVPRILQKDRKRYEKNAQDDGLKDFQFKEWLKFGELKRAGTRDDYYVVYFNEPLIKNKAVMGFDNGSEALRRKVLLDTARKGVMICSPPIKLLQGKKGQKGYLVYVPVYENGIYPGTPEKRLKRLKGFAAGVFIADELVKSMLEAQSLQTTCISIDDITDPGNPQNLCFIGTPNADNSLKHYNYDQIFKISSRRWRFHLIPSALYPVPSIFPAEARLSFSLLLVFTVFALMIHRTKMVRMLNESNVRYKGYIEHSPEGVYIVDNKGKYLDVNRAATIQTGYSYDELLMLSIPEITYPDDINTAVSAFMKLQETGAVSVELRLKKKNGGFTQVIVNATKLQDGNYMAFCVDITEQKRIESELEVLATTDPLTHVANRRHFLEFGDNELSRSKRYGRPFSILMMDIDHFKRINDKYGHAAGDAILAELAATCRTMLRDADMIGRLGGEEFAVILPETDTDGAYALAERLRKELAAMSVVNISGIIKITVSIGIAAYHPGDNANLDSILAMADKAMFAAKDLGRNRVVSNGE